MTIASAIDGHVCSLKDCQCQRETGLTLDAIRELESSLGQIQDAVTDLATPQNEERVEGIVVALGEARRALLIEIERREQAGDGS